MSELFSVMPHPKPAAPTSQPTRARLTPRIARLHHAWLAVATFLFGAIGTLDVSEQLATTIRAKDAERFTSAVDRLQDSMTGRIETYVAMLRAGAGLAMADPDLDASQFHAFVGGLELQSHYPGIQGLGYSRRVPASEVPAMLARFRRHDPAFRIWPDGPRPEYQAIVFLEPIDRRNRMAIGYDMSTDAVRAEAMGRARDTGAPTASAPLMLVRDPGEPEEPGFVIYTPVYATGGVPPTVEARRAHLTGFVYGRFRNAELFRGALGAADGPDAGFELVDAARGEPMYATGRRPDAPRFTDTRRFVVAGRPWTASLFSLPGLDRGSNAGIVPTVRWVGLGLTSFVSFLVLFQTRARARLERSEVETRAAAETNAQLYEQVQTLLSRERQARAEVERVSRLKDQFLATLSHELRTPLNAIQGWTQMLSTLTLSPERQRHAITTIARNATLQAQLVDDLLDTSRITSGRVQLEFARVALLALVRSAVNAIRPTADAKRITLEMQADGSAPTVRADAKRLQQVFGNLFTNALKFTPEDGRIDVEVCTRGETAVVTVRDTGAGIGPEFLPFVFERFRQEDQSIGRRHGGLGLGLSIVKDLVEMHGGAVDVASPGLGHGATFTVCLPVEASTAADPGGPSGASAAGPPGHLQDLAVLAVDDDQDSRDLLRDILVHHGASAHVVASAAEALDALRGEPDRYDLLVSDIGMPDMDGYSLIAAIRAQVAHAGGQIPAIALTAYASVDDRARTLAAGFDMHIAKPVMPYELVAACLAFVRGGRGAAASGGGLDGPTPAPEA